MANKKEDIFYVNVNGADELRRDILESSKMIVEILKNYERFKSANKEKQKEIGNLKLKIKNILKLISKLRSALPSAKSKALKEKKPKVEVKKQTKQATTELDKLEQELNEIESRINSLS